MTVYEKIKYLREKRGMSQQELANRVGFKTASAVNKIELGLRDINQNKILAFAKALETTPAYLLDDGERFKAPEVTSDVVVFKVIGTVAAGYDELALEDWSGETVSVPAEYLKGRSKDEFFVLSVHGDSMYPLYMNGDKVLILKQSTLNRSGEISAVLYEGDRINVLPVPADGYEVDQVTFDGVALDYNSATGYWTSGPVYQGGTVTIAFRALEGQGAGDGAGCSGSAVTLACGGIAGCGLAGGALLVLRKRPKQQ